MGHLNTHALNLQQDRKCSDVEKFTRDGGFTAEDTLPGSHSSDYITRCDSHSFVRPSASALFRGSHILQSSQVLRVCDKKEETNRETHSRNPF